jgi:RNA polymerase primary sigma factor
MRFGLTQEPPKTLEEIAQKYRVTRERIRQIEAVALSKIRRAMERRDCPSAEAADRNDYAIAA